MAGGTAERAGTADADVDHEGTQPDADLPSAATTAAAPEANGDSAVDEARSTPIRGLLFGATAAAILPILVAGVRAALRGWYPTDDQGLIAIRARDVLTGNHPLLGMWSSASVYSDREMNHPGPLHFDLLALPVRLFGHGAGTALGVALTNAACVALIAWLLVRRGQRSTALVAVAGCALLAWSFGSQMLYDPWTLHSMLFPFALFLVAVWCVVAGDVVALPVMAFAGSLVLQVHVSYVLLVPGLMAVAAAAVVVLVVRGRLERRPALRWGLAGLAVLLLCWSQPIYEATEPGEWNATRLVRGAGDPAAHPSLQMTISMVGDTVAAPPMWLPPSFGDPGFMREAYPWWAAGGFLLAVVAALVVLGVRALRRGSTLVAAGSVVALVALAIAFETVRRTPVRMGIVVTYARFLWPLAMVVWIVLAVGIVEEVSLRWPALRRRLAPALAVAAVAVVAGLATLPTTNNTGTDLDWAVDAARAIDDDVVAGLEGKGPVVIESDWHREALSMTPAVMIALQDAGIPFLVDNLGMARQVGEGRLYSPGEAEWRVIVRATTSADPGPGEELIASWTGLTEEDEAEIETLRQSLTDRIERHGLPVSQDDRASLEAIENTVVLAILDTPDPDPDALLSSHDFSLAAPYLDEDRFPKDMVERWVDLQTKAEDRVIEVYIRRESPN